DAPPRPGARKLHRYATVEEREFTVRDQNGRTREKYGREKTHNAGEEHSPALDNRTNLLLDLDAATNRLGFGHGDLLAGEDRFDGILDVLLLGLRLVHVAIERADVGHLLILVDHELVRG